MKILYVAYLDLKEESFAGVKKKIESQIKAFIKLKNEVNLLYISDEKICIKGKVEYEKNVKKGISNYRKAVYQEIINLSQDYDMIYIRFPGVMDFYTYQLIKKMCEKGIKCILEVPTYPIKGEYEKVLNTYWKEKKYIQYIKRILVYVMHYYYSNKLHKTNLKIVTYMPYDTIWKIPTVIIDNGVDTSQINKVEPKNHDTFNLTVVANVNIWHGVDRLISGLAEFAKEKNIKDIKIKIAGVGPEIKKLKKLVTSKGLENNVEFLGLLQNEELDELYNITDVAISSLGMHRIHVNNGSTIKTKEYCSKGIPFVLAYNERLLQDDFPYALKLPATEEPIDIEKIMQFYNRLQDCDYRDEMHKFAIKNYDWNVQVEKILENI